MSSSILYMSMSLDGFIAGPDPRPDQGLGKGGERLHDWPFPGAEGSVNRRVCDEFLSTGAVVAGRGTFEPAGGWEGNHHANVPIFIFSRGPVPDWASRWPGVTYTADLNGAFAAAKAAAGERGVLVHGAGVAQRALTAGLLDEIEIHLIPVLLGEGVRLFERLGPQHRELERVRVIEGEGGVTHLRYRVLR